MRDDEGEKIVERVVNQLGEHFDAVQVMATRLNEGDTQSIYRGYGNWYARQGMAHEFINADVAQENARQIAEQLEVEDGDDEDGGGE